MKGWAWWVLAGAFSLVTNTAQGFQTAGTGWSSDTVAFHVDPSLEDLSPDALGFLADGARLWVDAGAPQLDFSVSTTPLPREVTDRQNVIAVYRDEWPYDPSQIAVTVRKRNLFTHRLEGADIYINAHDHNWGPGAFDLRSCLIHELGHVMDLAHEGHDHAAVMYQHLEPGQFKRDLTDDDRAGIRHIYQERLAAMGCMESGPSAWASNALLWWVVVRWRRTLRRGAQ